MQAQSEQYRRIASLIASARQAADQGRTDQAEAWLRQAEMQSPGHPLILNIKAVRLLAAGQAQTAADILSDIVEDDRTNPEIWFNLGKAMEALGRLDEALKAFNRVVELDPRSVMGLLEKGNIETMQDSPRAAAMSYRQALQLMPAGMPVPPAMEPLLARARKAVDANSIALENYIDDGLRDIKSRFPGMAFDRFDRCVDIILQKRRIFTQRPSFLYFPEMPAIEFYDRNLFPWLDEIEAATDDIRAELVDVLSEGTALLEPYIKDMPEGIWRDLNNSRKWSVYYLWNEGKAFSEHIARCPRTVAALKNWPRWDVPGCGPTAMFSILDAHSRIPPHTGPVNTRLTVHIPLIVPPGCTFRVGGQTRGWIPGQAFVFDDSIDHEARNDSDLPRAVLIVNTWSPYISEAERDLLRSLTRYIGEYYGTFSNANADSANAA